MENETWVIEWKIDGDVLSVLLLSEYLRLSNRAFSLGRDYDAGLIFGVFPTEEGAREHCAGWLEKKRLHPLSETERKGRLLRELAFLFGEGAQRSGGIDLIPPPSQNLR